MEQTETQTGIVTKFDAARGYGFIESDSSGRGIFFHHTNIVMEGYRTIDAGAPVEYSVERTDDGRWKAVNVTPITDWKAV